MMLVERFAHAATGDTVSVPDNPPAMLTIAGLTKRFGRVTAVEDLDLVAYPGEFIALLGPSGCGKTTTLRLIAGFEQPDSGAIEIDGQTVAGDGHFLPPERRRIGMMFQEYALFPHLTVGKNIAYGIPRGGDRDRRVEEALALVDLEGFRDRMPHQLSGGQQQRVALARALATRPVVMLLDEPFSNLDPERRTQIRADVRAILKRAGVTVLLVTHDQEEALSLADRVAVMLDGRVEQLATPEELYHYPATRAVARFIGDAQWLPGLAEGDRVVTALGEVDAHNPSHGPVDVLIRPEMVEICPPDQVASQRTGVITERHFFGHDQLATIELATGEQVQSRWISRDWRRPGDRVGIRLHGPVQIFPKEFAGL
jgi:iron(III) transport system ATP-binding protein